MKISFSLIFLFFLFACQQAKAQKPVLNHLAIYVKDLDKSVSFYEHILELDTIPEPFHDGRHKWFSIGHKSHLHVISGASQPTPKEKQNHMCFSLPSVEVFAAKLKRAGIAFEDLDGSQGAITTRVDKVKQIYLKDPDGYWIEINDARD